MSSAKPFLLIVAILFGFALHLSSVQAREIRTAIFAGGCFWCVEADFDKVNGVVNTTTGFIGGTVKNPTYKQVSRGGTGHYEAVRIRFDADIVSYRQLVDIFWRSVDPVDADGQFCDRGDTYRTALFVENKSQRADAQASKAAASAVLKRKIVTKILPAGAFYPAEKYHQDYSYSKVRVITRFGWVTKAKAYKKYRTACGRDIRVRALWGDAAPFAEAS
ncbi:MAG: peptide-methionine (S)-S-oxide reductase MsrA [Alphaproteobacteria bacterium]|nr:peptide-methionine (S)-S-oxide reductase MsrA [Alphaproteobacteria bacterium]